MQKRSSNPKDLNLLAAAIAADTTSESKYPTAPKPEKNPNAVALGRLGGVKGGTARARKLTPDRRRAIAEAAARARWQKPG